MTEKEKQLFHELTVLRAKGADLLEQPFMRGVKRSVVEKYSDQAHFIYELLQNADGIIVQDDLEKFIYPMPINAEGTDKVYVGRIRRDDSIENGLNLWVVADNIRKGAATNAIQILEKMIKR